MGIDVFPHNFSASRDLKQASEVPLANQRIPVRQTLCIRNPGTEEIAFSAFSILPDDFLVAGSTSMTRENGIGWSRRCGPLSKMSRLPLASGVGACWPHRGGAPSFQMIVPVFRSMMMTVEMVRKLTTMSPFGNSARPLPFVQASRGSWIAVIRSVSGSRCSQRRYSQTVAHPLSSRADSPHTFRRYAQCLPFHL